MTLTTDKAANNLPTLLGPTVNLQSTRNSAVAGYVAGFVGVVLGHPLDSLKVWAQTSSMGTNKHFAISGASSSGIGSLPSPQTTKISQTATLVRPTSRSTSSITTASMSTLASHASATTCTLPTTSTTTFQTSRVFRTIRALYSGASGPLVTVGIVQSINFSTYDAMRRMLHRHDVPNAPRDDYLHNDSLFNVGIAGFVAGTGLAFITSPLIMVKTQQQITGIGFREAFRETLFRANGKLNLSGCFVGFYPHYLSETVGRSLYYCVYEACKRQTAAYKQSQGLAPTVSLTERMAAAAMAGVSCWTMIFPLDALRNRLYSQAGRRVANPLSTLEMARTMYQERSLYRGFSLTVLRAGPVAAVVLPVYDLVLEQLSS